MNDHQTLVFVPTYNEAENVERICSEILECGMNVDLLFLDDHSKDGTGEILDRLAGKDSRVKVLHRSRKLGIGSAHLAGVHWAYVRGYTALITMDCDFTHDPRYLSEFMKYTKDYDVVVGSRYLRKDSLEDWNRFRFVLTWLGHFLTKRFLKMPYDATGSYRLYCLDKIPGACFELVQSRGYSFFFESLYILYMNGYSIKEVPIVLPARTYGSSKMNTRDVLQSIFHLTRLYFITLTKRNKFRIQKPLVSHNDSPCLKDSWGWDIYWADKKGGVEWMYDWSATLYRKYIIKRSLNYFIERFFTKDAGLLHAGCGSGQVDIDISKKMKITALDMSLSALHRYREFNKGVDIIQGSIFQIPLRDKSVDGIYNLGVMEHFTEEDIQKILSEFHRVLKPNGMMVIFWPPTFGMSVVALKIAHFVLNKIFKRNIKLHPDELTRIRSKKHSQVIFEKARFRPIRYYFGIKDLFTHWVIIVSKGR